LIAGVPEGVPLVARLEDQVAWAADHDLVAEQRAHLPLDDVAVFVLARMAVQQCRERARRERVLDEREPVASLLTVDHEADADAAEEPCSAATWPDHLRRHVA
jgi:hypothetical protein